MISELNDEEILDFLMTSEFESDFSPEELKYLLVKFRYFYRLLFGKYESSKTEIERLSSLSNEKVSIKQEEISQLLSQIATLRNSIELYKSKKLTLKERISGKINFEDENK